MEIDAWPPKVGATIIMKCPHMPTEIIGVVDNVVDNSAAVRCESGSVTLLPDYYWEYVSEETSRFTDTIYDLPKHGAPFNRDDVEILKPDGNPDLNNLFMDEQFVEDGNEFSIYISDAATDCEYPNRVRQKELREHLMSNNRLQDKDVGFATSNLLTYKNIMNSKNDIEWEGKRIFEQIEKDLTADFWEQLDGSVFRSYIQNGYLFFVRNGCPAHDTVSEELVGKPLVHFKSMLGKPIDYNILRFMLFKNRFQQSLQQDGEIVDEAASVLRLEYLICMQPNPNYLFWCLKRLLLCWCAEGILLKNIRKIKVLINQYRGKSDEEYNKRNGVLPSILIYPKYGVSSASAVVRKINEYFIFNKNMGWEGSHPTYFRKIDNLLYYTNGLIDLKIYYQNVLRSSNDSIVNRVYNGKYTGFKGFNDPFNTIQKI